MKKSCLSQEPKVVTTNDSDNVLNPTKDSKDILTQEQVLINEKLLESGVPDEGLGWLEKRTIFKTINASLDGAGSERLSRSSPRLVKGSNSRAGKWIENSFENTKQDEKVTKTTTKKDSECKKSVIISPKKQKNSATQEINSVKFNNSNNKTQTKSEINKSNKKVTVIQIEVEENSQDNSVTEENNKEITVISSKKRASQNEIESSETPKKFKMEETNNEISSVKETPVNIELETDIIERSEPIQIRDIKSIVSELDIRNKKWKETFLKYKTPARWGIPIVRHCSEKWDGKQIPPKLLQRYQKYLLSKNLTHPIFFPVRPQSGDLIKFNEISSQSAGCINSEFTNESESNYRDFDENSYIQDDTDPVRVENNLNASTSMRGSPGRMVLRNRTQPKTVISDDEEVSSDDSDDWMDKQKTSKKQKTNTRIKKSLEHNNKQLVLKLEKCDISRDDGHETSNRSSNKNDINYGGGSSMSSNSTSSTGGSVKSGPDPDTMVCPICSLRFKKQHIESHATECASKTYKD